MLHLPDDDRLLHHALALARGAAAFASPNPAVGCVFARNGELLASGAHRYDARDHAEIVALKQAAEQGIDLRGATAYVSLEPCSHHGRTGPCADALIAAGIGRCVVATVDPNPLVSGQGLAKLRTAGVEVALAAPASPIAQAARRLNDAFAFSIQHGRPFVTLKTALSADGRLAPSPSTRTRRAPHWLTGAAARADVQQLRHASDVLLTGIGTVLADDPGLTDRTGLPRRRPLLRVVLDPHLRLPLTSQLLRTAAEDLLVLGGQHAPASSQTTLEAAGATVARLPERDGRLSLPAALQYLFDLGMRSVLLEAGPTLNGAFLTDNLVDKAVLYRAPVTLGPEALPFTPQGPTSDELALSLTSQTLQQFPREDAQVDLQLAGYFHDPWANLPAAGNAIP